ncbi:MAG: flagellar export chaperone FliS [Vibrionaceae bacterium]
MRGSLQAYKKVSIDSQLTEASPHKVIQMLMAGAIERLIQAKIAIEQKNTALKGEKIGKALDIVVNLRACLSMEDGGEIAQNLDALYDYIIRQVSIANLENNTLLLDEAVVILREIKSAWEQIPEKYRNSVPQEE